MGINRTGDAKATGVDDIRAWTTYTLWMCFGPISNALFSLWARLLLGAWWKLLSSNLLIFQDPVITRV